MKLAVGSAPGPGKRCKFLYEDYHRGRDSRQCRLPRAPGSNGDWDLGLCGACPVPGLLKSNPCAHLALEGRIERRWLVSRRMELYAVCAARLKEVGDPKGCRRGCPDYRPRPSPSPDPTLLPAGARRPPGYWDPGSIAPRFPDRPTRRGFPPATGRRPPGRGCCRPSGTAPPSLRSIELVAHPEGLHRARPSAQDPHHPRAHPMLAHRRPVCVSGVRNRKNSHDATKPA